MAGLIFGAIPVAVYLYQSYGSLEKAKHEVQVTGNAARAPTHTWQPPNFSRFTHGPAVPLAQRADHPNMMQPSKRYAKPHPMLHNINTQSNITKSEFYIRKYEEMRGEASTWENRYLEKNASGLSLDPTFLQKGTRVYPAPQILKSRPSHVAHSISYKPESFVKT